MGLLSNVEKSLLGVFWRWTPPKSPTATPGVLPQVGALLPLLHRKCSKQLNIYLCSIIICVHVSCRSHSPIGNVLSIVTFIAAVLAKMLCSAAAVLYVLSIKLLRLSIFSASSLIGCCIKSL